jgi:hypothetical protein
MSRGRVVTSRNSLNFSSIPVTHNDRSQYSSESKSASKSIRSGEKGKAPALVIVISNSGTEGS